MDEKICAYCFDYLKQNPQEPNWAYEKRRYCGKSCAAKHSKNRKKGKPQVIIKRDYTQIFARMGE